MYIYMYIYVYICMYICIYMYCFCGAPFTVFCYILIGCNSTPVLVHHHTPTWHNKHHNNVSDLARYRVYTVSDTNIKCLKIIQQCTHYN